MHGSVQGQFAQRLVAVMEWSLRVATLLRCLAVIAWVTGRVPRSSDVGVWSLLLADLEDEYPSHQTALDGQCWEVG